VSEVIETVVRRTIEIAEVPAPTGAEGERAAVVRSWWEGDGLGDVHTDGVGNVWARVRGGDGPIVILCAHLDTVFGSEVPHTVKVEGSTLVGPSVGDDSVGIASLSAAGVSLSVRGVPLWLLATVGEEGLGNLCGVNAALDAPPAPVAAFVAVEGNYLGRVSTIGVGSVRRRVRLRGPGGHAWEAADAPSAVHSLAQLVASIAAIPRRRGTSVNVGRVGGGEGINVRAREAWFELDLRADDPEGLAAVTREVEDLLEVVDPTFDVEQDVLGDRPAGSVDPRHPLVRAAKDALSEQGTSSLSPATSTDANAAHARGIPAIAVGVTRGSGEHTAQEWIETGPIEDGVRALARTVERFEELSA
jgi:acetylornithine deacetylase/succinyl-diaminopimelate desuccinylase-like protein